MRKTDRVSQDKPEIRLHRYEHILTVKWPTCALADDLAQPGPGTCRAR